MAHITAYCCALVLLALSLAAHAQTLGLIDCNAVPVMAADGRTHTFDFTSLQRFTLSPLRANDSTRFETYNISMFNNIDCDGTPTAVCQKAANGFWPCGVGFASNTTADWIPESVKYPGGAVTFRLNPTGSPARYSLITVICDVIDFAPFEPTVVSPEGSETPPYLYEVSLYHRSVCINDGGDNPSPLASASLVFMSSAFTLAILLTSIIDQSW